MTCPDCDGDRIAFAVPSSLRPYAPDEALSATLCTTCLRVAGVDAEDSEVEPSETIEWGPLPSGEAGVATALLLGLLDSLALRRADVTALCEHAEEAGGDPFLTLDRLAAMAETGDLDPHVDLERRTAQLQSLVD
ncbi:hypothetical protein C2R22_01310 [Salinigranum rubrum]|uniref:Small CPxCG-related zinc finger protein n=1 Tax=Salinigranum rubrum TaxID=755307 RepID=A0A2I8VEV2_9EURY|nr:DUF6276 family protein [Salinigranum rubrum]AUV80460.1 hypothetical protein C2R22_01310 [Salinigranum rubrum]